MKNIQNCTIIIGKAPGVELVVVVVMLTLQKNFEALKSRLEKEKDKMRSAH